MIINLHFKMIPKKHLSSMHFQILRFPSITLLTSFYRLSSMKTLKTHPNTSKYCLINHQSILLANTANKPLKSETVVGGLSYLSALNCKIQKLFFNKASLIKFSFNGYTVSLFSETVQKVSSKTPIIKMNPFGFRRLFRLPMICW